MTANQRHEYAGIVLLLGVARSGPVNDGEVLKARRTDRNNESAAVTQLFSQGIRDRGCSGGDQYPIERSLCRQAFCSIADAHIDVGEPERREQPPRRVRESRMPLDRENASGEPRKNRGLVPGARANFENAVLRL